MKTGFLTLKKAYRDYKKWIKAFEKISLSIFLIACMYQIHYMFVLRNTINCIFSTCSSTPPTDTGYRSQTVYFSNHYTQLPTPTAKKRKHYFLLVSDQNHIVH